MLCPKCMEPTKVLNTRENANRVEFICPICGGKAIGNRYMYGGRIHGLGSGCTKCGIRHS